MTAQATAASHPDIPVRLHKAIFPLYNPSTIDLVLFWELPAQKRAGHILLQGPTLGAGHAALREIVRAAQVMKVKRSMYAETQRERAAILEAVQACEWNREDDPVAVFVQDGAVVEHDFRQGCVVRVAKSCVVADPLWRTGLVTYRWRLRSATSRAHILRG